jgi:fermentation-respiration switch protein FrsA (DUF1100 family)
MIIAAVALIVIAVGAGAVANWHFSSAVLVPDHSAWPENVTVKNVAPGRIVLSRSEGTLRPGVYGLDWPTGHAMVGAVLSSNDAGVARRLVAVNGYLVAGMRVGLPSFAADPLEWMIGARIDADWSSLDALQHPGDFHLPILLFHGTEDKTVPIATSNEFAKELSGWITYYRVPHAGHVESWNVDPKLYEQRLTIFLSRIMGAA